jgi:hypothetical protein
MSQLLWPELIGRPLVKSGINPRIALPPEIREMTDKRCMFDHQFVALTGPCSIAVTN